MKQTIVSIIAIILTSCIAFAFGRYNFIPTSEPFGIMCLNYKDAYLAEKAIASASLELNHLWYSNDDNDYWFDVVIKTKEYQNLDSALCGDWEDFYYYETPLMWDGITYQPGYCY